MQRIIHLSFLLSTVMAAALLTGCSHMSITTPKNKISGDVGYIPQTFSDSTTGAFVKHSLDLTLTAEPGVYATYSAQCNCYTVVLAGQQMDLHESSLSLTTAYDLCENVATC